MESTFIMSNDENSSLNNEECLRSNSPNNLIETSKNLQNKKNLSNDENKNFKEIIEIESNNKETLCKC